MPAEPDDRQQGSWWRGAVIYQIYPRSFMDTDGDGVGDLRGITSRLDHVAALGVDAIWVSPFFTSPMTDFGYDVADYRNVDPMFGTLGDFAALIERAHALGLKVLIDQVLSHSSDQHPWFTESRVSRDNAKADWYVWADPAPDGGPPNNWLSVFGGPAWTLDPARGQYYLHNFLTSQPDLNFHCEAVRTAQLDNVRFWLELGVDGFRFDVVNFYFHDRSLTDNPIIARGESPHSNASPHNPYYEQRHVHDIDQPENIAFLQSLRGVMDEYGETTSIGEISSDDSLGVMAEYTRGGDRLHMAYSFDLLGERRDARFVARTLRALEARLGDGWPCWSLGNHDVSRVASRWAAHAAHPQRFLRTAMAMLLCLRGSVCLYQGEEFGFEDGAVTREQLRDPFGIEFWPEIKGRDGCRTPIAWSPEPGGGFTSGAPWLPVDAGQRAIAASLQAQDEGSMLRWTQRFIAWRRAQLALIDGAVEVLHDDGLLVLARSSESQTLVLAFNLSDEVQRWRAPFDIEDAGAPGADGALTGGVVEVPANGMQAILRA